MESIPNKASDDEQNSLSLAHFKMLREGSGISPEVIAARGYRTITNPRELAQLGFSTKQQRTPGLLLPGHAPDGSNGFYTYRPDSARVEVDRRKREPDGNFKQRVIKYEIPAGASVRLDCPRACLDKVKDPGIPLWLTEGQKKADAMVSHGLCAVDILGVWNFKGKNDFGGSTWLADWDYIAFKGRDVRIVFDSDVMTKREVKSALDRLTEHMQRKGAHVSAVYLPGGRENKVGVDDFLLDHTVEELQSLVDAPRPKAQAAAPVFELLDDSPLVKRRPLSLFNGRAYAAIWPHVRVTISETSDKDGNIIKHDPPVVTTEQRLLIVRDDGVIFGEGGSRPMEELSLDVRLGEIPSADKLWSTPGVKAFRKGDRPEPVTIFNQIVDVVDRFISFKDSLADQRTMAEMIACYIMSTWFLDAFNVVGFLWPNGERGSGKTQLLTVIAELGYLGQVILAGGSFAALRDLADYGAFLAFDDAENLSDPKKTDPDKRTLLLAGNRRGNTVPLKEPASDRTWRTRYVNTFCPRAFSAIQLPDATLASRTIIVPLVRTSDPYRANADPAKYSMWPHDRRKMVDDLWSLGLTHLPELTRYESFVDESAHLTGRNLEPWRPVLAVAAWLEEAGAEGLWDRMVKLSIDYQQERHELETDDLSVLVVQAVFFCVVPDMGDVGDIKDIGDITLEQSHWTFKTSQIVAAAREIVSDLELDVDADSPHFNKHVGRKLAALRFNKTRIGKGKDRGWMITAEALEERARAFGLIKEPLTQPPMATSPMSPMSPMSPPSEPTTTWSDGFSVQEDGSDEIERAETEAIQAEACGSQFMDAEGNVYVPAEAQL